MATARTTAISTDEGSCYLKVEYGFTSTQIQWRPYIVITNGFKKKHDIEVTWKGPKGNDVKLIWPSKKAAGTYAHSNDVLRKNGDYSITLKLKVNGKTQSLTITSNRKPDKPTIAVRRVNDNHYTIEVKGSGKKAVPVNTVIVERQEATENDSWTQVTSRSMGGDTDSYSITEKDQATEAGTRYRWRARAINQAGSSGNVVSNWQYNTPPEPQNITHERRSNAHNRLSWTRSQQDVDRRLVTGYIIQRKENGGSWQVIENDAGTGSSGSNLVFFNDYTAKRDASYSYRVKAFNSMVTAVNAYPTDGTTETYNTPGMPTGVSAVYTSSGDINVKWTNSSKGTATKIAIQRKVGAAAWEDLTEIEFTTSHSGSYIDEDVPTGENIRYRLRNIRADSALTAAEQVSEWVETSNVSTLIKPNKPTPVTPASNAMVTTDQEAVRIEWIHNPLDGTEQEEATLQYKIGTGSYSSVTITGDNAYYNLPVESFPANSTITWRVKTKGAHVSFSDYSAEKKFRMVARPQLHFTSPANGDVIDSMPVTMAWSYTDLSGSLKSLTLDISEDGEIKKTLAIPVGSGAPGTYSYDIVDYLLENGASYELRSTAVSTTGLSSVDTLSVDIDYEPVRLENGATADAVYE